MAPLYFRLDVTPSLVCYDEPCPFEPTKPAAAVTNWTFATDQYVYNDAPCLRTGEQYFDMNVTCSPLNIISRSPDHGPQAGGNRVVMATNLPLGFLDMKISFGHEDGLTEPVAIESLFFLDYVWREVNNAVNPNTGGILYYFSSVITVTAPPHPAGIVQLHIYVGNDVELSERITKQYLPYSYDCPPGTYETLGTDPVSGATNVSTCVVCPPGTFTDTFGAQACEPCIGGTFNPDFNRTTCELCPAGTYSAATSANSSDTCLPCPVGYYNPLTGQTVCTACGAGEAQSKVGQTKCDPCPAGWFNDLPAQQNCTKCRAGTYQPYTSATYCLLCSVGKYSAEPASTSCYDCLPGYTTSGRNSTGCYACPAGSYRPSTSTRCLQCAPGRYTDQAGLSVCSLCEATYYNTAYNQTDCIACDEGTTNIKRGSTGCSQLTLRQTQGDISLLMIGILLVIAAVIVLICGVSYVIYRRKIQGRKKRELEKLKELMQIAPSSQ